MRWRYDRAAGSVWSAAALKWTKSIVPLALCSIMKCAGRRALSAAFPLRRIRRLPEAARESRDWWEGSWRRRRVRCEEGRQSGPVGNDRCARHARTVQWQGRQHGTENEAA